VVREKAAVLAQYAVICTFGCAALTLRGNNETSALVSSMKLFTGQVEMPPALAFAGLKSDGAL